MNDLGGRRHRKLRRMGRGGGEGPKTRKGEGDDGLPSKKRAIILSNVQVSGERARARANVKHARIVG